MIGMIQVSRPGRHLIMLPAVCACKGSYAYSCSYSYSYSYSYSCSCSCSLAPGPNLPPFFLLLLPETSAAEQRPKAGVRAGVGLGGGRRAGEGARERER